jgi:hypothetical protein
VQVELAIMLPTAAAGVKRCRIITAAGTVAWVTEKTLNGDRVLQPVKNYSQ